MTFANTKQSTKTTVVFFPHALKGSLVNALQKENLTGWEILKWADAEKKYGAKCPRDENGRPSIRIYPDIPGTTNQIKAFVSNFNADDILTKIYQLHYDPDAETYRDNVSETIKKSLQEDGMI